MNNKKNLTKFNWAINKFGVLYKILYRFFWDFKLSGSLLYFSNECQPVLAGSTATQSVDYFLLRESLKILNFNDLKSLEVADIGCGRGRLIAYIRNKNHLNDYFGYEINCSVADDTRSFFKNQPNVSILNSNVLLKENKFKHDLFFLFNPFSADLFDAFLSNIKDLKNVKILYINASSDHMSVAKKYYENDSLHEVVLFKPHLSIINTRIIYICLKEQK